MAHETSLWTSSSDKEFRDLSKFHSLQQRRLGLEMAAIQREHARQAQRVRVQTRETGTLVSQYEAEKEKRARHLLHTFSKVQRKRQAAQDWKTAVQRRSSEAAEPSTTFDVQIGHARAPWGGGARRDSTLSSTSSSSRRRSSTGSSTTRWLSSGGLGVVGVTTPRRGSGWTWSGGATSLTLPPISWAGSLAQRRRSSSPSIFPASIARTWRTALERRKERGEENADVRQEEDEKKEEKEEEQRGPEKGSEWVARRGARKKRELWTHTFPFVYHSVGETVCPRYKLFLQYDEFKVDPVRVKGQAKRSSLSAPLSTVGSGRPSLRAVTQGMLALTALTRTSLSSLSLDQGHE